MIPAFSHGEIEPVRVPKLNKLADRVTSLETNGTGGAVFGIDGGNATSSGASSTAIDGGSA